MSETGFIIHDNIYFWLDCHPKPIEFHMWVVNHQPDLAVCHGCLPSLEAQQRMCGGMPRGLLWEQGEKPVLSMRLVQSDSVMLGPLGA